MITSHECDLMAHALGHDSNRGVVAKNKRADRNYFAAGPGDEDDRTWQGLGERGFARMTPPREGYPYNCWIVTDDGKLELEAFIVAPKDALGEVIDPTATYYIEEASQVVGNCVLWWGKNRSGYTCALDEAGVYTGAEAVGIVRMRCEATDHAWPEAYILARVHRHVRVEPLDRVRAQPKRRPKPPAKRRKAVDA